MTSTPVTREKKERASPGFTSPLCKQFKMVDCSVALEQCPNEDYDKVAEYIAQISYQSRRLSYAKTCRQI